MASVNDKKKAAGTGGGKRSHSSATYSKNPSVGSRDFTFDERRQIVEKYGDNSAGGHNPTKLAEKYGLKPQPLTPQEKNARKGMSREQRNVMNTLGLSAVEVQQLSTRQIQNINSNVKNYNREQINKLSKIYKNIAKDKMIRSGQAGMSKIDTQKYLENQSSKRYENNVQYGEKPKIIKNAGKVILGYDTFGNPIQYNNYMGQPREYNDKARSYESKQSGNWKSSDYTIENLAKAVKTQGDWNYVLSIAKSSTFGLSGIDKKRIKVARDYIIRTSDNPNYKKLFEKIDEGNNYNNNYKIATQKITSRMTDAEKKVIQKARDWVVENSKNKGELKEIFSEIDHPTGTKLNVYAPVFKNKKEEEEFYKNREKEYQERLKKEDMEKEVEKYKNGGKIQETLGNLYERTYDIKNIEKSLAKENRKIEYHVTKPLIQEKVSKVTDTKLAKNIDNEMQKDPALKAISGFVKDEYTNLTKKPIQYAAETVALAGAGKGLKIGSKGLKKITEKGVKKAVGEKAAEKVILRKAGKELAIKNIPMVAVDVGFIAQIGNQYVKGSNVNGENLSGIIDLYHNKKIGNDVNFVTKQNLELTKDLAIMGVGAREKKVKEIKKPTIKESYKKKLESKKVKDMSTKEVEQLRKQNLKKIKARKKLAAAKAKEKSKVKNYTHKEAVKLAKKNKILITRRKVRAAKKAQSKKKLKDLTHKEASELAINNRKRMEARKKRAINRAKAKKKLKNMNYNEAALQQKKNLKLMEERKAKAIERANAKKKLKNMNYNEAKKLAEENKKKAEENKNKQREKAKSKAESNNKIKGMTHEQAIRLAKKNREKAKKKGRNFSFKKLRNNIINHNKKYDYLDKFNTKEEQIRLNKLYNKSNTSDIKFDHNKKYEYLEKFKTPEEQKRLRHSIKNKLKNNKNVDITNNYKYLEKFNTKEEQIRLNKLLNNKEIKKPNEAQNNYEYLEKFKTLEEQMRIEKLFNNKEIKNNDHNKKYDYLEKFKTPEEQKRLKQDFNEPKNNKNKNKKYGYLEKFKTPEEQKRLKLKFIENQENQIYEIYDLFSKNDIPVQNIQDLLLVSDLQIPLPKIKPKIIKPKIESEIKPTIKQRELQRQRELKEKINIEKRKPEIKKRNTSEIKKEANKRIIITAISRQISEADKAIKDQLKYMEEIKNRNITKNTIKNLNKNSTKNSIKNSTKQKTKQDIKQKTKQDIKQDIKIKNKLKTSNTIKQIEEPIIPPIIPKTSSKTKTRKSKRKSSKRNVIVRNKIGKLF